MDEWNNILNHKCLFWYANHTDSKMDIYLQAEKIN